MPSPLPPSDLLDALARHGFARDPAQRLRAERVIATLGAGRSPAALRPLLAPVVAQSEEEQARFDELFDALVTVPVEQPGPARTGESEAEVRQPPVRTARRRGPIVAAAAALAVSAAVAAVVAPAVTGRVGGWIAGDEVDAVAVAPDTAAAPPEAAADSAPRARDEDPEPLLADPLPVLLPTARADEAPAEGVPWALLRLFAVLLPAALSLAYLAWRRIFVRPVVMRGPEAVSPFALQAPPPRPGFPWAPAALRAASRAAARRQAADTVAFSASASVAATVAAGGYPTFLFTAHTRPTEYLFLIERRGVRDQQAALFASLVDGLRSGGVLAARYFFDADPRLCHPEEGGRGIGLAELARDHPGHRLLICGDGRVLANPVTGELLPWTRALQAWTGRALLTPEPVGRWGLREGFLAQELPVFPATLDGVREAAEFLAVETDPDWYDWWECHPGAPEPDPPVALQPEALRGYLGDRAFRWLCACAVYPEVHWRLTLLLGARVEPSDADGEAVERDLLRLAALPWMRRGSIANRDREMLLEALGPEGQAAARTEILRVLDGLADAPRGTRTVRMELDRTVQRLYLHAGEPRQRRRLLRLVRKLPRGPLVQDVAVVRMLAGLPRSRLHLPLPRRLNQAIYQHGLPAFGMRPWALGAAAAVAALASFAAPWPTPGLPLPLPILEAALPPGGSVPLPDSLTLPGGERAGVEWSSPDPSSVTITGTPSAQGPSARLEAGVARFARVRVRAASGSRRGGFPVVSDTFGALVWVGGRTLADSAALLVPVLPHRRAATWGSCDPRVAEVDARGHVLARARGRAAVVAAHPLPGGYLFEVGAVDVTANTFARAAAAPPGKFATAAGGPEAVRSACEAMRGYLGQTGRTDSLFPAAPPPVAPDAPADTALQAVAAADTAAAPADTAAPPARDPAARQDPPKVPPGGRRTAPSGRRGDPVRVQPVTQGPAGSGATVVTPPVTQPPASAPVYPPPAEQPAAQQPAAQQPAVEEPAAAPASDFAPNEQERRLGELLTSDRRQARTTLRHSTVLARVARERALDMARRRYVRAVDPDGVGLNTLVERAGYRLPPNYDHSLAGDNISSLANRYNTTAESIWRWWMSSNHRDHVLGLQPEFALQNEYGIGYVRGPRGDIWVILIARRAPSDSASP